MGPASVEFLRTPRAKQMRLIPSGGRATVTLASRDDGQWVPKCQADWSPLQRYDFLQPTARIRRGICDAKLKHLSLPVDVFDIDLHKVTLVRSAIVSPCAVRSAQSSMHGFAVAQ